MFQKLKRKILLKKITMLKKARSIELRTLTVGDFDKFSDLIEDFVSKTGDDSIKKLIDSMSQEPPKEPAQGEAKEDAKDVEISVVVEIGMSIVSKIRRFLKDEASEFFAYLLDKTIDEYKAMPIDTPLLILKAIRTAPEAETFFTMQSLPSNMTELFDGTLDKIKKKLDSTLAEIKKSS